MGYDDRHYSRYGSGDGFGAQFARLTNWSFSIGTYLDIRVRVNIWFFVLPISLYGLTGHLWHTVQMTAIWFLSVLLHEFGHALGCRSVGGTADDILMWPLGGLAYVAPPRTVWANFVTTACGPLVNVVLAAAAYATLWFISEGGPPVSLNPFRPYNFGAVYLGDIGWLLVSIYIANYYLLLFNLLLVFYPFDGGRIVQIGLWKLTNYHTSMVWACRVGLGGGVLVAIVGLAKTSIMLTLIGVFGFITCYQQGQALKYGGGDDDAGESWKYASHGEPRGGNGILARWRAGRAAKRRAREAAFDERIGNILAKVKDHGLHSLTRGEKKLLKRETERLRSG